MELTPTIVQSGDGTVLNAYGDTVQVKLGAQETQGQMTVVLSSTLPGGGPPPHIHHSEDELFLVLEGRIRFLANSQWTEVAPGGVVYIPRGSVHTFQNIGETPSRQWVITTPSGFEDFFAKSAAVFAIPGAPDMARLLDISAEHGIEFVNPDL